MLIRRVIALVFAGTLGCSAAQAADVYPSRPVKIVIGFAAGGAADVIARIAANSLSKRLGQPIIIENKPGSGGNIAAQTVVSADPDGYTLHFIAASDAINTSLYTKRNFDIRKDLAPVVGVVSLPVILFVNSQFPAKTYPEFVAYARANPGKVNLASPGTGTTAHMEIEVLNMLTGAGVQHVPYRSTGAVTDVISGQVQGMYAAIMTAIPQIQSGAVRPLYVTSDTRNPYLPDVPSASELKDAPDLNSWFGLTAPQGTPAAIIDQLAEQMRLTLAEPEVAKRFAELGGAPLNLGPAQFGAFIAREIERYGKAVKASGASVD